MNNISEKNNIQDSRLSKLEVQIDNFDKKFDSFISNDFEHLRRIVSWVFGLVTLGILIPIVLFIIK